MKFILYKFILFAVLLNCLYCEGYSQNKAVLTLQIEGIEQSAGYMMVAVYDEADQFLSKNMFDGSKNKVNNTGTMKISLELPFGEYGISVFHDIDADGELDTNLIGIPKEPTGFSNNAKGKFGPPKYEQVKFSFTESGQRLVIRLE